MRKLGGFVLTVVTFVLNNWGLLASMLGGGTAMTWAAWATEWLQPWGRIGWVSAAILGVLAGALLFALIHWARSWISLTRAYNVMAQRTDQINPMKGSFRKEHLSINDFFLPTARPYRNSIFEDCRIIGPGVIHMTGNVHIDDCYFQNCNYVVVKDKSFVTGMVLFENPKIIRTEFHFVTIILHERVGALFRDTMNAELIGYEINGTPPKQISEAPSSDADPKT